MLNKDKARDGKLDTSNFGSNKVIDNEMMDDDDLHTSKIRLATNDRNIVENDHI
jgi:hypothetical protein